MSTTEKAPHGDRHPLCQSADGDQPWEIAPGLFAWTLNGDVALQGDDGDVTVPREQLAALATGLLAVHVHNGRQRFEVNT